MIQKKWLAHIKQWYGSRWGDRRVVPDAGMLKKQPQPQQQPTESHKPETALAKVRDARVVPVGHHTPEDQGKQSGGEGQVAEGAEVEDGDDGVGHHWIHLEVVFRGWMDAERAME